MSSSSINEKLSRLRARRSGSDRLAVLTRDAQEFIVNKSRYQETWERRAATKPATTFALGAMQEVDKDYTRISIETAERVQNQLTKRLETSGIYTEYRLQGSVPLNVHIRGVSDVDLLVFHCGFFTYSTNGARALAGEYIYPSPRTSLEVLNELRRECQNSLKLAFPAATVDVNGEKAIKLYGGSLARPVDVVPAHWFDSVEFQSSGQSDDRAVTILEYYKQKTLDNWPFLHIKLITERCVAAYGSLRKSIRLCKNVKAELIAEGRQVNLSSFDIASAMYHADQANLRNGMFFELAILAETQRHLDYLYMNKEYARSLRTPDNSRYIFDSEEKFSALLTLSVAMDELLREVAKEHSYGLSLIEKPGLTESRSALSSVVIPSL
ncbi:hypothetical protein L5C66_28545 [Pseudomonas aeruginosa]|uniref:hypothetical protein n=1 Tax=Pseudomonas aeruginosa TaxID=287 RepID=UPI001F2F3D22|nr:hypothetical protein [Pseudomonas aeruginosa]MDG3714352.1 hypothetical protein [Pseudomonas aeruginosa]